MTVEATRISPEMQGVVDEMLQSVKRRLTKVIAPWGRAWQLMFCRGGDIYLRFRDGKRLLVARGSYSKAGTVVLVGQKTPVEFEVEIREEGMIRGELTMMYGEPPRSPLDEVTRQIMVQRPVAEARAVTVEGAKGD